VKAVLAVVFCAVLALLAVRATRLKFADTFLDPIGRVDAQDEAMYAHDALHLKSPTPTYQGRLSLNKPPLLVWTAAASAKIFGANAWAVRLPVTIAGAITACLAFLWRRNFVAVLLLVSDRIWFVLSSLCLTDGLLAASVTGAAYCLWRDPKLESRPARWGFAILTAAAVTAKSVAGVLPLFILFVYCLLSRNSPTWRRVLGVTIAAGAMVAPWCIYELIVHPKWFWNEFVLSEILVYGVASPVQTTQENQALFYLKRLVAMDPVLAALAIPALWAAWRRGERVLVAWTAVVFATAILWSYRNVTYLAPAVPALAIASAGLLRWRWAVVPAALVLLVKVAFPGQPWGIELRPGILHPSIAMLDEYVQMRRGRELILVEPFEGFYSATLPLPKVRYVFVAPGGVPPQPPLDLHYLGILVNSEEFAQVDRLTPLWRARLREWGLDSDEPIATGIVARSKEDLDRLIASRPQADFLLPAPGGGFRFQLARQ
jgi:4-amino-4-deoxy-L-arabinose transferase-like glycosyltransferase